MNERLRSKLADWLEFYRDLGIESLYLREVQDSSSVDTETGQTAPRRSSPLSPAPVPAAASSRPGPPGTSLGLFDEPLPQLGPDSLERIRQDLGDCHRCKLWPHRKTIVFGTGNPKAQLVFVGEAPGADEDEQGLPFVGRAGQLLNRMIESIGMQREDVYICNVIKCRPPENRTPEKDEIASCEPFLFRQLEVIHPRLICCLGSPAVQTLLRIKEGITRIRGQFLEYRGIKVLPTFHPAYILRNNREEAKLREDFMRIRAFLESAS